ncbi:response regulator [Candidatus Omnitrophota bacterium]
MKGKVSILLVDDEKDFLEPITFFLKSKNYSVAQANNGREALKIIKSDPPDIVFMDLRMPVMDGIQTLTQVREFNRDLPVIMLTAYGDEKTIAAAHDLGISGFFPKKGDVDQLVSMIETTLRLHRRISPQDKKSKDETK